MTEYSINFCKQDNKWLVNGIKMENFIYTSNDDSIIIYTWKKNLLIHTQKLYNYSNVKIENKGNYYKYYILPESKSITFKSSDGSVILELNEFGKIKLIEQ